MAIIKCWKCSEDTSSLGLNCARCGAAQRSRARVHPRVPPSVRVGPLLLLVTASALAASPVLTQLNVYREATAAKRDQADRTAQAQQKAFEQVMTRRADSLIRAMPVTRFKTIDERRLRTGMLVVSKWRSDAASKRWVSSAQRELLQRKSAKRSRVSRPVPLTDTLTPSPVVQSPPRRLSIYPGNDTTDWSSIAAETTALTRQPAKPPVRIGTETKLSGPTARCRDGTYSYSAHRRGTCSHHGGVAVWY